MDTIAINANETLNEQGQEKKKFKVSNAARTAMSTGTAGLAAGAAAKTAFDALTGDKAATDEEQPAQHDAHIAQHEEVAAAESIAEVNPDDVMLEEPVAEPSTETDMIAGAEPQAETGEEGEYQPFANNDRIEDDVLPEPQPDEVLIAENAEVEVVAEDDPTVDLICGLPETEPEILVDPVYPGDELYADNGSEYDESGIQSDLMA